MISRYDAGPSAMSALRVPRPGCCPPGVARTPKSFSAAAIPCPTSGTVYTRWSTCANTRTSSAASPNTEQTASSTASSAPTSLMARPLYADTPLNNVGPPAAASIHHAAHLCRCPDHLDRGDGSSREPLVPEGVDGQ